MILLPRGLSLSHIDTTELKKRVRSPCLRRLARLGRKRPRLFGTKSWLARVRHALLVRPQQNSVHVTSVSMSVGTSQACFVGTSATEGMLCWYIRNRVTSVWYIGWHKSGMICWYVRKRIPLKLRPFDTLVGTSQACFVGTSATEFRSSYVGLIRRLARIMRRSSYICDWIGERCVT